ncbi:uncharacterized protein LOC127764400 [Oryza glaberrima]|uniref:uncharacterized protein LOC127764400 n=1 Tax=Oryza glaberrima TaxID=4538 RepID=UPI00224C2566|nr:uncharacterized protein LOC127764400 [Oryza glaberrima]XP_052145244.1 uncharacterized protein LOC127764400 [Oryza glaberrima]
MKIWVEGNQDAHIIVYLQERLQSHSLCYCGAQAVAAAAAAAAWDSISMVAAVSYHLVPVRPLSGTQSCISLMLAPCQLGNTADLSESSHTQLRTTASRRYVTCRSPSPVRTILTVVVVVALLLLRLHTTCERRRRLALAHAQFTALA